MEIEELPERLLAGAIAAGAEAAEVFQSYSLARPVIFEGNRLKQAETSQSEGVALRLWRDGKPGLAVGYGPIELQILVEKALAISTLNLPETPRLSVGGQKNFGAAGADTGAAVTTEQLVAWGRAAISQIRDHYPAVVCEAELSCDLEETRLINSTGLDYRSQDTTLSGYLSAELISPDNFLCVGDGTVNRHTLDMSAVVDSIVQRLGWANRTVAPVTGQVPVIFTTGAAWLLWDTLRAALNAKRVAEGISPWSQRQGDRAVAKAVNLSQDPTVGPYSCPFDDEGARTQHLVLVEDGIVKSWYGDLANGSTGNGIRPGLGSYPTPGLINLLVTPGNLTWDALVAQQEDAIIVDQVLGEGGDITGDLSISLDLGYRVSQGEIVGRVKDTMVSGNAYSALNHLIALGSDLKWSGSTYTPSVAVDGLSITG